MGRWRVWRLQSLEDTQTPSIKTDFPPIPPTPEVSRLKHCYTKINTEKNQNKIMSKLYRKF